MDKEICYVPLCRPKLTALPLVHLPGKVAIEWPAYIANTAGGLTRREHYIRNISFTKKLILDCREVSVFEPLLFTL